MFKAFLKQLEQRSPVETLLSRSKDLFQRDSCGHPIFSQKGFLGPADVPGKRGALISGHCGPGRREMVIFAAKGDTEKRHCKEGLPDTLVSLGIQGNAWLRGKSFSGLMPHPTWA